MDSVFDIAVIGAGAMGSAAAFQLSKTGKRILVIDKFIPPHEFGSSHGESRIIREAYFESPMYVPLVQQAYESWDALEKESGKNLFLKTGGLMIGHKQQRLFRGASNSATVHNVPYEFLDAIGIKKRFPAFRPEEEDVAVFEHRAGILFPEECIRTQLQLAKDHGAIFQFDESVIKIEKKNNGIQIITDKNKYQANKVIVTAGAWMNDLFPELNLPLSVKRQVAYWFKPKNANSGIFLPENFPIYIWEYHENKMFYGFPDLGHGIKIAIHHQGKSTTADTVNRNVTDNEVDELTELLRKHFHIDPVFSRAQVCMYTNTPDEDFIIDYHPSNENIILVSACSGHGFKFSSAIGKIISDMATSQPLNFDIMPFGLWRFDKK